MAKTDCPLPGFSPVSDPYPGSHPHKQADSRLKSSHYLTELVLWSMYFKHGNPKRNQRLTFEMFLEVSQSS